MKKVQQCRNQTESGNQESAFDVETHETEVPFGKLAAERTAKEIDPIR